MKTLAFWTLLAALALSACGPIRQYDPRRLLEDRTDYPPYEGAGYTKRDWTERERLLARADFSAEVVRLSDARRVRTLTGATPDQMLYDYDADDLLEGMTYRLPVLFNKYLTWKPKQAKHYLIEIEVVELLTHVKTGTFWTGSFGRYEVTSEMRVLARRPDSRVALSKLYRFVREEPRRSYNGRSPTAEMDRARVYDMVEDMVRLTTERMLWDLRMKDSRYWKLTDKPLPVRIEATPATDVLRDGGAAVMEGGLPLEMGAAHEAPLQLPDDEPLLPPTRTLPVIPPVQLLTPSEGVSESVWAPRV